MKRFFLLVATCLFPLIAFSQNSSLLKDAQDLFAAGNYSSAVNKFQEAMNKLSGRERNIAQLQLSTAKTCVEALNKAQAAVSAKNYDTAIAEYQKVLDANPNDTRVKGLQDDARRLKNQELNPTLTVSKNTLSFSSSSGSQKITVYCSTSWILVDQSSSMCTVSRSGNEITVACSVNTSTSSRNTSFVVRTANGVKEQRISVSQAGRSSSSSSSSSTSVNGKLTVKPTSISLSSGSGTTIVDVLANGRDYEVSLLPSWAKVKTKNATWFSLSYTENPNSTTRSDWFNVKAGGETVRVSITQSGKSSSRSTSSSASSSSSSSGLSVKPTSISLSSGGGITFVDISTNARDYQITNLPGWLQLKNKHDSFFSLNYSPNNSSSTRSGWFNVSAGGKTIRVNVSQYGKYSSYSTSSSSTTNNYKSKKFPDKQWGISTFADVGFSDNYNENWYILSYGIGAELRLKEYDSRTNYVLGADLRRTGYVYYDYGSKYVTHIMIPAYINFSIWDDPSGNMYLSAGAQIGIGIEGNNVAPYPFAFVGRWGVCSRHFDLNMYLMGYVSSPFTNRTTLPTIGARMSYYF